MQKVILKFAALAVLSSLLTSLAFAQSTTSDPMNYVKSLQSNTLTHSKASIRSFTTNTSTTDDNLYKHSFGTDKAAVKKMASELERSYGAPKMGRGDLKVWEIKNPNRSSTHAKHITIMLGSNSHGEQELIVDQRGPGRRSAAKKFRKTSKPQRQETIISQSQIPERQPSTASSSARIQQPKQLID